MYFDMVKLLSFSNIKGRTATYTLGKISIFIGSNRRGKTAALDSMDYACYGYVPKMRSKDAAGVPLSELFKLSSGSYMAAKVITDSGTNSRRIDKRGDKLTKTETVEVVFDPMLRDQALYFALSPAARVALVASKVALTPEQSRGFSVRELLASVKNIRLETNSAASESAILECYNGLATINPAIPPLDWISGAIAHVKESAKLANATRKTLTATGVGITLLQQQDEQQVAVSGAAETKLRVIRDKLGELQSAVGTKEAELTEANRKQSRRDALAAVQKPDVDEAKLAMNRDNAAHLLHAASKRKTERTVTTEQQSGTVARLKVELDAANKENKAAVARIEELAKVKKPEGIDADTLTAKKAALEASVATLQARVARRDKSVITLERDIHNAAVGRQSQVISYNNAKKDIGTVESDIKSFMACAECPTCKATGGEWQARWKAQQDAKITTLHQEQDIATVEGTRLKKLIESLEGTLTQYRGEDAELQNFTKDAADIALMLAQNKSALDAYDAAKAEDLKLRQQCIEVHATTIHSLELMHGEAQTFYNILLTEDTELANLRQAHDNALVELSAGTSSLSRWTAAQAELLTIPVQNIAGAEAAVAQARECVAERQREVKLLEEQVKGVVLARADLKRQMDAVTASERSQASVDILKAAKELLETKQAELVAVAFDSLLDTVNKFTSVLMPPLIYEAGDVGYWSDGVFASSSTFSGAEEAVLFVGLCCALASAAKEKVVVIDEVSRFSKEHKPALVKRLLELCASGIIHQAVLADVDGDAYRGVECVTVIDV